jgi:hypothetical protein
MESIGAVQREALLPAVENGARDPHLTTGCADVAQFFGSAQDVETESVYLVFEGHRQASQVT